MHPHTFIKKHKLTQHQLAELFGVSVYLVKKWFARDNPRQPEQRYLNRFTEIDALVEIKKVINEKFPSHLEKLFDSNKKS